MLLLRLVVPQRQVISVPVILLSFCLLPFPEDILGTTKGCM